MSNYNATLNPPWWQNKKVMARIVIILIIAIALITAAYTFHWDWTGLSSSPKKTVITEVIQSPQKKVTTTEEDQPAKTVWDWLQLLAALAIPVVVGLGAAYITKRQSDISEANRQQQHNTDTQIADQRQQDEFLQIYFDKMSELLLEKGLRNSQASDEIRHIVQALTFSALRRLNATHNRTLLDFLFGSDLLHRTADKGIIELQNANLSKVELDDADLHQADLRGANLFNAQLHQANLQGADLQKADLRYANLTEAKLQGANLTGAILIGADLQKADLQEAILTTDQLKGANNVTTDQLTQIISPKQKVP
jgi:uncharacterized protein YjbI with pentapeptide repeats